MPYLASSSSSVLWIASVSYLVLHWATSALALVRQRCSSPFASCSSSYCSLSRSESWRADCTAWARAFLACEKRWKFKALSQYHLDASRIYIYVLLQMVINVVIIYMRVCLLGIRSLESLSLLLKLLSFLTHTFPMSVVLTKKSVKQQQQQKLFYILNS